jgi:hypothetical protein
MHFHTRRADLLGGQGSANEGIANRIQVLCCSGASIGLSLVNQSGWTQRGELRVGTVAALFANRSLVPQLQKHAATGAVHRVEATLPRAHGRVVDATEERHLRGGRVIDRARLGNNQSYAALYALPVVFSHPRLRHSVVTPATLHSRHDEAVGQGEALDRKRSEQRFQIQVRHGVSRRYCSVSFSR